jgi:hypothetical protein
MHQIMRKTNSAAKNLRESENTRFLSPAPASVSSSISSDVSDEEPKVYPIAPGMAGDVSPSTTCQRRVLSAAIVTEPNPLVAQELLHGRPTILLPNLERASLHRACTVPIDTRRYVESATTPYHPLRLDAWAEVAAENFAVRGSSYLQDSKKIPSAASLFTLWTVDLVSSEKPNFGGMCAHPQERIQTAMRMEKLRGVKMLPEFIFAVNLCVPANGNSKSCYHCVFYFGIEDMSQLTSDDTPWGRLTKAFFFGDSDSFRDSTFKLIPRIVEGNFVVRKAVGSKPSILGNKLAQRYIHTDRYFELIVDISSDNVATRIVKLALGYAKTLTVDMMFLLEGTTEKTLPERILGGVRMINVDFKKKDGQRVCSCAP